MFTIICVVWSNCLLSPSVSRLKTLWRATVVAIIAAIMLVDALSTISVFSASEIASEEEWFIFEAGKHWIAMHWMGFGLGFLGAGMLVFAPMLCTTQAVAVETPDPMLPTVGGQRR